VGEKQPALLKKPTNNDFGREMEQTYSNHSKGGKISRVYSMGQGQESVSSINCENKKVDSYIFLKPLGIKTSECWIWQAERFSNG
jgi:hypothetical protein